MLVALKGNCRTSWFPNINVTTELSNVFEENVLTHQSPCALFTVDSSSVESRVHVESILTYAQSLGSS